MFKLVLCARVMVYCVITVMHYCVDSYCEFDFL